MLQIENIGAYIFALVATINSQWDANKSLLDNVLDVSISILSKLTGSVAKFFYQNAVRAEASLAALTTGDGKAVVATDSIEGQDYSVIIVKHNSATGAALGLGTDPNPADTTVPTA